MKLVFVNIMHNLYRLDSTASISQPPVPLGVLAAVTPDSIDTSLLDEQTEPLHWEGDVFAFTVATQFAAKAYAYARELRAAGKKVIMGGIHVTVRPEEAMMHADAVVTGEAESLWPRVCEDLLNGGLKQRYDGSPTPPEAMVPVDYRFFEGRNYLTPASLYATRGCNQGCAFCVSSRRMGPFRTKPLNILEQEIDQLRRLYPRAFLQFTDDNLLADRRHAYEVMALIRRKKGCFITMVTLDQLSDFGLVEEMADSGCLGVAVGVESPDEDNRLAVGKRQSSGNRLPEAVRYANRKGIQVCALLMAGMPLDTPESLELTRAYLEEIPLSLYDLRILRPYPGSSLYKKLLATGGVRDSWWLREEGPSSNAFMPGHLRVHMIHEHFSPTELQRIALKLTLSLDRMTPRAVAHILGVGQRRGALKFALTLLAARWKTVQQYASLLRRLDSHCAQGSTRRDSGKGMDIG